MFRCIPLALLALALLIVPTISHAQHASTSGFLENRGQIADLEGHPRPDIIASASIGQGQLYLRSSALSYVIARVERDPAPQLRAHNDLSDLLHPDPLHFLDTSGKLSLYRVDAEFVGANPAPRISKSKASTDFTNYYLGHCPGGVLGVRRFQTITYHDLYPKVDLVLHATDSGVKSEFVVHPGGDPKQIRLRYSEPVELTREGGLMVRTDLGVIEEEAPVSFVRTGERESMVPSRFVVEGREMVYGVGEYDSDATLVIDPLTRIWATYIGGTGAELAWSVAASPNGSVYVGGVTQSANFPASTGAHQTARAGTTDLFIARLNAGGGRIWATYYGGNETSGKETPGYGGCVAASRNGDVALTGTSNSLNFPVSTGALPGGAEDVVVVVLDSNGTRRWATRLAGASAEGGYGATYDHRGNLVVVGGSKSANFPTTTGAFQTARAGSANSDIFISKFSPTGTVRWSTFFSGSGGGIGLTVTVNGGDSIFVSGMAGTGLPTTTGVFQSTIPSATSVVPFVAVLDSNGARRWATYLSSTASGTHSNWGDGIGVDVSGSVTVVGFADSVLMPTTTGAFQATYQGGATDIFIARLTPGGTRLHWCTHLGGSSTEDLATVLAVAQDGTVSVAGSTLSANFPVTADGYQTALRGTQDGFFCRFDSTGHLLWSTYYGGSAIDALGGLALDSTGAVYLCGATTSTDASMTTAGVFQTTYGGGTDGMITRFECAPLTPTVDSTGFLCAGDTSSRILLSADPRFHNYRWSTGETSRTITVRSAGTYTLLATDSINCPSALRSITVVAGQPPSASITASTLRLCTGDSAALDASPAGPYGYLWSTGANTPRIVVNDSGSYRVIITDTNGCRDTATIHISRFTPTRPTLAPSGTVSLCVGDSVPLVAVAPAAVRWRWSNGDTTRAILARTAGLYSVTITDTAGCTAISDTVSVVTNPLPAPTINSSKGLSFCEGDSTILSLAGTFTRYRWSTGETTPSITARASGSYWVEITDANGCRGRDTVALLLRHSARPVISGPNSVCIGAEEVYTVGDSVQLPVTWTVPAANGTIVAGQGTRTLRVQWSVAGTGSVQIDADNGGCPRSEKIDVTIATELHPTLAPSGTITLCTGDSATIAAPSGYTNYRWNTGDTTRQITVKANGSYWVAVTSGSGCSGVSDTVAVTTAATPTVRISANGPLALCLGDSVTLDAGSGLFGRILWSTGDTTQKITVKATGNYWLELHTPEGCVAYSDTVTVSSLAASSLAITWSTLVLCPGDSAVLDAGSGYVDYRWSTGERTQQIVVRTAGNYWAEVTARGGCKASDTVSVSSLSSSSLTITPSAPVLCPGDSTVLDAGAGYASYRWSTGETSQMIVVRGAGSYWVEAMASGGCSAGDTVVVNTTTPQTPSITRIGNDLEASISQPPAASYQWSLDGATLTGGTTQRITPIDSGDYTVTVLDTNGCRTTSLPYHFSIDAPPPPPPVDTASARLAIGSYSATPGAMVAITPRLTDAQNLTSGAVYTLRLRFDRTLLVPSSSTLATTTVLPNEREVEISGQLRTSGPTIELDTIHLLATLGRALSTPLAVSSFVIDSVGTLQLDTAAGEFQLDEICAQGTTRLVGVTGETVLKVWQPNPAIERAEVEYEVVEDGVVRIRLVDMVGRQERTLLLGAHRPGRYRLAVDVHDLPAGSYTCILNTPTEVRTQQVRVLR